MGLSGAAGGDTTPPRLHMAYVTPEGVEHTTHEALTNTLRPLTDCFLTLRIIKSFEFRTTKNLLLPHVDVTKVTVGDLKDICREQVKTAPGFKAYRTCQLDTLKLYATAHGHKTMNLIINLEHDDDILRDDSVTLASVGIENESEISFFNGETYEAFKKNPQQSW